MENALQVDSPEMNDTDRAAANPPTIVNPDPKVPEFTRTQDLVYGGCARCERRAQWLATLEQRLLDVSGLCTDNDFDRRMLADWIRRNV